MHTATTALSRSRFGQSCCVSSEFQKPVGQSIEALGHSQVVSFVTKVMHVSFVEDEVLFKTTKSGVHRDFEKRGVSREIFQ